MPNQRAANKKQFGITFTKEDLAIVDAAAKAAGLTRTEYIVRTVMKDLAKEKNKNQK